MDRATREETARRHVDSAESWLRKIIHHELSSAIGKDYLRAEGILKKEALRQIESKLAQPSSNFMRPIDATTFEQAIALATHPDRYARYFKLAFSAGYPLGREQAVLYLNRLKDIRNNVSHGRGCTARQLEQAICYSNDLVDSLKDHFRRIGVGKHFDVPMIVRYTDNRGNESHLDDVPSDVQTRILDWRGMGHGDLHPGDVLVAEVEIDQSYDPSTYKVSWWSPGSGWVEGPKLRIEIGNRHVGELMTIEFQVVSNRDWHRQSGVDDKLLVGYRVLPPIAE